MILERRSYKQNDGSTAKKIVLIVETEGESKAIDEVLGDCGGNVLPIKGSVRQADGYGEHYILLEPVVLEIGTTDQRTTGASRNPDNASHSVRKSEEAGHVSGSTIPAIGLEAAARLCDEEARMWRAKGICDSAAAVEASAARIRSYARHGTIPTVDATKQESQ